MMELLDENNTPFLKEDTKLLLDLVKDKAVVKAKHAFVRFSYKGKTLENTLETVQYQQM